jgi:hypothetical protein
MRFETPPPQESSEAETVRKIIEKARELKKTWVWPTNVHKALEAFDFAGPEEREATLAKVMSELGRRGGKKAARKRSSEAGAIERDAANTESAKYETEERERESKED